MIFFPEQDIAGMNELGLFWHMLWISVWLKKKKTGEKSMNCEEIENM